VGLQHYAKEPAVTGHSLGGALAQMAAARFPDLVAKVVTFQSPGISKGMAEQVKAANDKSEAAGKGETVVSHHYQVNGDLVGKTGEALTEGQVSDIQRPTGYMLRHTGYVTDYASAHPESATRSDADSRMPGKLEPLRKGLGKFLGAIQKITHTGPEEYIEVWENVRDAIDRDAKPADIRTIIDRSKLSGDDKSWMREQLSDTLAANDYEQHHAPEHDIRTAE
jgi:pimeloyl-ACP methyl ester carboxylesterase